MDLLRLHASGGVIFACWAVCMIDRASGWFEACSASAAALSNSAPFTPSAGARRETANLPVVIVPVLSNTKVSQFDAASRYWLCLIMMPRRAAAVNAGHGDRAGDEQGRRADRDEHGDRASTASSLLVEDAMYQTRPDVTSATGTKYRATCSMTSRGVRVDSASEMSSATLPIVVSPPTSVVRSSMVPLMFVVPANTSAGRLRRAALTGQRRLIDGRLARDDHAVDRQVLAGSDADDHADLHISERDLALLPSSTIRGVGVRPTRSSMARAPSGTTEGLVKDQQDERDIAGGGVVADREHRQDRERRERQVDGRPRQSS